MHMGESKQQPRALPGEQWAAHSPTRAPDFITGLSIPPAWELWDLGQAAAADRSALTQHTQQTYSMRRSRRRIPPLTALSTPRLCIHTLSPAAGERGKRGVVSSPFPVSPAISLVYLKHSEVYFAG